MSKEQTFRRLHLFAILILAFFAAPGRSAEAAQNLWTWKDSLGQVKTRADLDQIIQDHKLWLDSEHHKGRKADFSGVDMRNVNLRAVNLADADLTHANLVGADLESANLTDTKLTQADLTSSDLGGAYLYGTDLTDTVLWRANLSGVVYEPSSYPPLSSICGALNMEYLTYEGYPTALVQLRKQFEDNGFRGAERKITYALMRREAEKEKEWGAWPKYAFNTVVFDWTTRYGLSPAHALYYWCGIFVVFSIIYFVFLRRVSKSRTRIARTRPVERGKCPFCNIFWDMMHALYFSLVTAFSLGVWDFNFGKWVRQIPTRDIRFKAEGRARPVAALQSILSVSLVAIWVLTYFGRPFQ